MVFLILTREHLSLIQVQSSHLLTKAIHDFSKNNVYNGIQRDRTLAQLGTASTKSTMSASHA